MRSIRQSVFTKSLHVLAGAAIVVATSIGFDYCAGPAYAAIPQLPAAVAAAVSTSNSADTAVSSTLFDTQRNSNLPSGIHAIGPDPGKGFVRLPGHVLDALATALPIKSGTTSSKSRTAKVQHHVMTLTVVLKRDHQAGFDRYMQDIYDPRSNHYHQFLTQAQIAKRFGPSRNSYGKVMSYLRENGLGLLSGSKNRLTI